MEKVDDPSETFSSSSDEMVEAVSLLEECWFYENLLDRRTRTMQRCYSDPSPSPCFSQEMLARDSSGKGSTRGNPSRALSLSPSPGREEAVQGIVGVSKPIQQSSRRNLHRTPSLPPCMGREAVVAQEKESERKMSKLTLQASPTIPITLPCPRPSESFNVSRHRPPRKPELETFNRNGWKEIRRRYLNQRKMKKKSVSDLEVEEVQGFKDLGFQFDKEALSPKVINILPGLQERKPAKNGDDDEERERRPYLSEAWVAQTCAPPVPAWGTNRSAGDMKAQIKFWARAVASNVRQEC